MKILVLAGGLSKERDVSLVSGSMVAAALRRLGHDVATLDLFFGVEEFPNDVDAFFANGGVEISGSVAENAPDLAKLRNAKQGASRVGAHVFELAQAADIVFLGLHGDDGEDGKIQAAFDLLGVKYTGSGFAASSAAMDKNIAKLIFADAGLQVPKGVTLAPDTPIPADLPLPCVVKPVAGGSSVATTLVEDAADLPAAIHAVWQLGDSALVETYVKGREIQVAVLGEEALPPILLDYDSAIFDYVVKYQSGACREICPAPISDALTRRLQEAALTAYRALGLSVYSRIDFIVTEDDDIYILEANTLPGMTATSLVPQEAAAAGIGYDELCETIIRLSLARFEEKH